jgi:hypothetical protein
MSKKRTLIGEQAWPEGGGEIAGQFVRMEDGGTFYRISHYDQMPPFFMSLVSSSDHWIFISSNGALTAGRRDPERAIFPYYTDDKIHDSQDITGSKTILRVRRGKDEFLWEPFSMRYEGVYPVTRHLYKSLYGDRLIFEETNSELGLRFRHGWSFSDKYGLVREVSLENISTEKVTVTVLDGLQNIMPCSVAQSMQANFSTLVDAYRKNELEAGCGLGIYSLSAVIVDRAEPSEALQCNTVWSLGLEGAVRLISSRQVDAFRRGKAPVEETDVRAERGAYFLVQTLALDPNEAARWRFAAAVEQDASAVRNSIVALANRGPLATDLDADLAAGRKKLERLVASADGWQMTGNPLQDNRHLSNVLFNIMRGGVFMRNHDLSKEDLRKHARNLSRNVATEHEKFFAALPDTVDYAELLEAAEADGSADLQRICLEYLPLGFSRRHGDPSRPWNKFAIILRNDDGTDALYYAGNWRDIFQNWEALARSFPAFLPGMIAKFVNASTVDGYNPYRITRDGIDWEIIEPHDPWSYIGYWGDHQIIYLLKLLEVLEDFFPSKLQTMLSRDIFTYANVPYQIRPYRELLANPKDTVVYDTAREAVITERVARTGADGKLVWGRDNRVYSVNLIEKLLVSLLAKLANYIPEAGLWLNTQRPEWNDANNALVGHGVSVVTLCHLRRFVVFLRELLQRPGCAEFSLSEEVADWLSATGRALEESLPLLETPFSDRDRKRVLDALGEAGSHYRNLVYPQGFSGEKKTVIRGSLLGFLENVLRHVDRSIASNEREDGLYHSYNLMSVTAGGEWIVIRRLGLMLEGQVAILNSGCLSPIACLRLLQALRQSKLYRADQRAYILYPDKVLPRFLEKNNIPKKAVASCQLFRQLLADGNRQLVGTDVEGGCHFHGSIRNAADVRRILAVLSQAGYAELVARDEARVLEIFEEMFDHQSFTGRSGTFFGYEGLGSIYWHMVSKLLLAAQEAYLTAREGGAVPEVVEQLAECYADIRSGIGFNKSPQEYGAFPADPYSHTPAHSGARQPGMTGQVKEDIISRFGELGIDVRDGCLHIRPRLLQDSEFINAPASFRHIDTRGTVKHMPVPAGALAFTFCQVPFCYLRGTGQQGIEINCADGTKKNIQGHALDQTLSAELFGREGKISSVTVSL